MERMAKWVGIENDIYNRARVFGFGLTISCGDVVVPTINGSENHEPDVSTKFIWWYFNLLHKHKCPWIILSERERMAKILINKALCNRCWQTQQIFPLMTYNWIILAPYLHFSQLHLIFYTCRLSFIKN